VHHFALLTAAIATNFAMALPPTFQSVFSANFPQPHGPTRFALADLDGDGHLDGVFPGRNTAGRVYLYRGAGDGTFVDPIEVIIGSQTDWVEITDVDGDGVVDLVLAVRSSNGRVAVLRGLGGFSFDAPVFSQVGREPRSVAVGDAGIDGSRALFSLQYGESSLRALAPVEGDAHVALERRPLTPWAAGVALPQWMGFADVDGDGQGDLLALSTGSGFLTVMRGAGGVALDPAQSWRMPLIEGERPGVSQGAVGDLDGDGDIDFATTGLLVTAPQSVVIMNNDGAGGFDPAPNVPVTFNGYGWAIALGDLDLDGDLDVVMTTALPGQIHILENLGGGTFSHGQEIELGNFTRHVWINDMDGDCKPDIVAVDLATNRLTVLRNVTVGVGGCGGIAGDDEVASSRRGARNARSATAHDEAAVYAEMSALDRARSEALAARVEHAKHEGPAAIARALADFGAEPEAVAADSPEGGVADAFESCGPPNGPCNEPHGAPGCFTTACCELVCKFDPLCCLKSWDEACVQSAQFLCGNLFCPSPGSCFEVHASRGCEDEDCCAIVSRLDGFCGSAFWDELCVIEAQLFCTEAPCELPPPSAQSIDELEPCYKRFNQGCAGNNAFSANWIELACGDSRHGTSSTGSPRDTDWFRFELAATTRVQFTVMAEFPARLLLIEGGCEGPIAQLEDLSASNCGALAVDRCLPAGLYHLVLGPGIEKRVITSGQPCDLIDPDAPPPNPEDPPFMPGHFGLHWQATLSCLSCGVPGDVNGDGLVNGADLAMILGSWGACPGCPADVTGDGVVNGADIAIVLGNWTG